MRLDPNNLDDRKILARVDGGRLLRELDGLEPAVAVPQEPQGGPGKSKYGNVKKTLFGIEFDSVKESRRYMVLRSREAGGKISGLEVHRSYDLAVNGHHICRYEADFVYERDGALVVEDVKSKITRKKESYRLKKKLMAAIHGIEISEVENVVG